MDIRPGRLALPEFSKRRTDLDDLFARLTSFISMSEIYRTGGLSLSQGKIDFSRFSAIDSLSERTLRAVPTSPEVRTSK
jgi:hypothetical protein